MAVLPPPPTKSPDGSFAWLDWYRKLREYVSFTGSIPWSVIDFTGSNITDILTRDHNTLTSIQGGTAGERYHLTAAQHTALGTSVPNTRQVIAGAGLTGGGDLSADRTFNVVAGDGSITVNANDITVGTINDTQHGNRGGGSLHAAATTSVAGFMSAADKLKLDGLGGTTTCFRAFRATSTQAISAATDTTIIYNSEQFDDTNEYDPTTGQFTVATTGKYFFSMSVFGTQATATAKVLKVFVNGSEAVRMKQTTAEPGSTPISGHSGVMTLSASDVVTFVYFSTLADTVQTSQQISWVSGYRIK